MALKIGIVGLPNVGKSTLFNALTKTKSAAAENYPFCTIDPNVGIVTVPDHRLAKLAVVNKSVKTIPAAIEFVDIAGLVKGASQGEGLGNKFLSNIRECDAIAHVLRNFNDENITHVHGTIDPRYDREVIESELILADMQTMEKRLEKASGEAKSGGKEKKEYFELLKMVEDRLKSGILVSNMELAEEEMLALRDLHMLTSKPVLYIINVHEHDLASFDINKVTTALKIADTTKIIPICAKVEEDLIGFNDDEIVEYLEQLGLTEPGLNALIRSAYDTLGLITYFTSGVTETRAWTINKGDLAPRAAGVIHTDFEKGFIKAEVVNWVHLHKYGGEAGAKEKGLLKIEGKEYEVKDGDVMHFRFSN